jgi:RimJ/RimL family protein N-acetyltransferase
LQTRSPSDHGRRRALQAAEQGLDATTSTRVSGDWRCKRNGGAAFAIEVQGALAGWLGYNEELDPDYRYVSLDIFLAPEYQGRRLGRLALWLAAGWLFDQRGHHRLTIDPACANTRAIRAYEAVGFHPVGVMRRYERGADGNWHDNLLMDLLRDELRDPTAPASGRGHDAAPRGGAG